MFKDIVGINHVDRRIFHGPSSQVLDESELVDEWIVFCVAIDIDSKYFSTFAAHFAKLPAKLARIAGLDSTATAQIEHDVAGLQQTLDAGVIGHGSIVAAKAAEFSLGIDDVGNMFGHGS